MLKIGNIAKVLLPLSLLLLAESSGVGQVPGFDVADFNKKFEIVQWLVTYDTVAWKTTDQMLANDKDEVPKLGREWFCFQDHNGAWHAVYGKLQDNKFDQILHYVVEAGKITKTKDKLDDGFALLHARALALAIARMREAVPADSPTHNSYIR